jgi:hypothetical protein
MAGVQQAEFRLYAYVCSVTCVKRSGDPPPTVNFAQVYLKRPPDCRYAIVGKWNYPTHGDRYYVFDLFEVKKNNDNGELLTPMPRLVHDDLDAAIMATVLLYNKPLIL